MLTDTDKDKIADTLADLFEGLDLEDVAGILVVQLALVASQEADSAEKAVQVLSRLWDQAEHILRNVPADPWQDHVAGRDKGIGN